MKSKPVINGNSVLQERENEEMNYLRQRCSGELEDMPVHAIAIFTLQQSRL
jgi:hypothetical protein